MIIGGVIESMRETSVDRSPGKASFMIMCQPPISGRKPAMHYSTGLPANCDKTLIMTVLAILIPKWHFYT